MAWLAEKRKQEEERRKKELELLEQQRQKEEELRKEQQKDISKKSLNQSKHQKDDEKFTEAEKPAEQPPEKKEEKAEGVPTETLVVPVEEKKEEIKKEEIKKEEPPFLLPLPKKIYVTKQEIVEKLADNYYLVLKTRNNMVAGELLLLKLVEEKDAKNPENILYYYTEYITNLGRIRPLKSAICAKESNLPSSTIWLPEQCPPHTDSYFTDIYNPLSSNNWDIWYKNIIQLNAVGFMTIPPLNIKWKNELDACIPHILPLPCEAITVTCPTIPIDSVILSQASYQKKILPENADSAMFTLRIF